MFWVLFEIPIQVPLVLTLLGIASSLAPAFYITALVLNLFQGAFLLARLVFTSRAEAAPIVRDAGVETGE